jgi:hypothetical protein
MRRPRRTLARLRSRPRTVALVAALAATTAVPVASALGSNAATSGCTATYSVVTSWAGGGFIGRVLVTNNGEPVTSWKLTWSFAAGQRLVTSWGGAGTQAGSAVTVANPSWNAALGTGATANVGFVGSYPSANPAPTDLSLNGVRCNATGSTPAPAPAPSASTTAPATALSAPTSSTTPTATVTPTSGAGGGSSAYDQHFLAMYKKLHDPANGYFSKTGVPYHSLETLIVEAPDYGHETTSEAFSYWMWIEAEYGRISGDWAAFNNAWAITEKYAIPSHADQPTNDNYNASKPATYAPESDNQKDYPARLDGSVPVGQDPLAGELKSAYGSSDVYGMHWLLDVDNKYGYGHCGDGTTAPAYINTFQRGSSESVWETVPQPSCDTFAFGGKNGYLDLFTGDNSYAKQWKYTDAPDADARAVQTAYWALQWATKQGKQAQISASVAKAVKMGDYLRYSMFDKYFKKIGNCTGASSCPGASGKDAEHYLLSWYYAWGGSVDTNNGWAWRIGDGASHQGYQNPLTAYALSSVTGMKPASSTGASDWAKSLTRQLEFYQWLQSAEGGIAGGATNSWQGAYATPPAGTPTFYGMAYDPQPVWHDPASNKWFGFQAWSMERVAEYYYVTGDATAKSILDKWVAWAVKNTKVNADNSFAIPSDLTWTGAPNTWSPGSPAANTGLHVSVATTTQDVGVAGSLAKTLSYYGAKADDAAAKTLAKQLLDAMWAADQDPQGVSVPETPTDYSRFNDPVYVPSGWTGKMPNGDPINSSSTFSSLRSWYKSDPSWSKVQSYLDGGSAPSFRYHRFWAQADVATAYAVYAEVLGG